MANSKFQQAREDVLAFIGELTAYWTEEEKREVTNTVNGIFFSGQIKPHPLVEARLKGQPRVNSRRRGRE